MKRFLYSLIGAALLCFSAASLSAQNMALLGVGSPPANASVTLGEVTQTGTDSGNANFVFYTPFFAPFSATTVTTINTWWGTTSSNTWGTAIYADSGTQLPGAKICSTTITSTPTNNAFSALTPPGCGTLVGGQLYWIALITSSGTVQQGTVTADALCPNLNHVTRFDDSAEGTTAFPSTAPLTDAGTHCYAQNIVLACSGVCNPASNVIPTDVFAFPGVTATGTTSTNNVVVPAGANLGLFVGGVSDKTPSGCTFNSVAMTQEWTPTHDGGLTFYGTGFFLANPSSGSHSLVCTWSSSVSTGWWVAATFINVNQTTPARTPPSPTSDGGTCNTNASLTVSNALSGDTVINFLESDTVGVIAATPNQTQLNFVSHQSGSAMNSGTQFVNATGSSSFTWTSASTFCWTMGGFALIPA